MSLCRTACVLWLLGTAAFVVNANPAGDDTLPTLRLIKADESPARPTGTLSEQIAAVTPAQPRGKIWALASAIGGQVMVVTPKLQVGSNLDPYVRNAAELVDKSLDALVLRGMDRAVARRDPDSERIFMRLNPVTMHDVPPPQREKVAFERLVAELTPIAQRQSWDRIVVVTPHYRAFEQNGLGSKLYGIGVYFQELYNVSEYDVVEPDGQPGRQRRSRFVALLYYAMISVLDAKTLQILSQEPWLIDQRIHDSNSASLSMARSIPVDVLAERLSEFAEQASDRALGRTLNLIIEVKDLKVVKPGAEQPAPVLPAAAPAR